MKKKVLKRVCSTAMGALMFVCLPLSVFAREIDVTSLTEGLSIDLANETEDLILTGINTQNGSVDLITVSGTDKTVILRNLSLDTSAIGGEALSVRGAGNIIIELDGTNILKSGWGRAGLQKENDGTLTIKDDKGTSGSLEAIGGEYGAGIGDGRNIGMGSNIIIEGGTITAIGSKEHPGIGGRWYADVTITSGNITAVGGTSGAGIGGGDSSGGASVTISNDAIVYAAGGVSNGLSGEGAAIGEGGSYYDNEDELDYCYQGAPDDGDFYIEETFVKVNGVETFDISGLYETGSVTTYPAGTTLEQIKEGSVTGVTVYGALPEPEETETLTQTPAENETVIQQTPNETSADPSTAKTTPAKTNEPTKKSEPPKKVIPEYTERSCIADVNVAALIAAALKADPNAKEINIEFGDNICLTPDIMKDLFADNRVAKNCIFSYEGKRYVLRINAVDTASATYADCFEVLKKEPGGLAGFKRMAQIFEVLNVTLRELDQ